MHRAMGLNASLMLMMSLCLIPISAQEPTPVPARTKGEVKGQPSPAQAVEPVKEKTGAPKTSTDEERIVTHHRVRVADKELRYTATAGLMPIRDAKGDVEARIFFMAYTHDDPPPVEARPLLFSFNGGPGSASVWLHLGALGPRRVVAPEEPAIPV